MNMSNQQSYLISLVKRAYNHCAISIAIATPSAVCSVKFIMGNCLLGLVATMCISAHIKLQFQKSDASISKMGIIW